METSIEKIEPHVNGVDTETDDAREKLEHKSEISPEVSIESVEPHTTTVEASTDEDLMSFFLMRAEINDPGSIKNSSRALTGYMNFKNRNENPQQICVVKDETGNVIGGAMLSVQEQNGTKRAYFGQKVVSPKFRGHGLGSKLVATRVATAKQEGCTTAYCLVEYDNAPGLRSILKDGFTMKPYPQELTEHTERQDDPWYLEASLTEPPIATAEQEPGNDAVEIQTAQEFGPKNILVPFHNTALIRKAITNGYEGMKLVLPKDRGEKMDDPNQEPALFLTKTK